MKGCSFLRFLCTLFVLMGFCAFDRTSIRLGRVFFDSGLGVLRSGFRVWVLGFRLLGGQGS